MRRTMFALLCSGQIAFAQVALITNSWEVTHAGTTITNAADWHDSGNWIGGVVPDSADYFVYLTNAVGPRYIKISAPLTLNTVNGTWDGGDVSILVSDFPLTIDDPTIHYQIGNGRFFLDITGQKAMGTRAAGQYCGRISSAEQFTLSGASQHRLDWYAHSADPARHDDFYAPFLYVGSGGWQMYAPRGAPALEGEWHVTAGSPYIFRVGAAHAIAAGTLVASGDAFPAGTFVKRVFADDCLELSAPADAETESGAKTLSFAAFAPQVVYRIDELRIGSWAAHQMAFMKHNDNDDIRVEIKSLAAVSRLTNCRFWPSVSGVGMKPARIVIHDADTTYAHNLQVPLGECHLEFAETGVEGATSGLPRSFVSFYNASSSARARMTVTNNIAARIGSFTNWTGTVVKDGLGTLTIAATNLTERNTGSLIVSEGAVEMVAGSWVKSVVVSNGATLKIDGDFMPDNLFLAPGAKVEGPGAIAVPTVGMLDGVQLLDGARARLPDAGEIFYEPPAPGVVGVPAFWIDASQSESMVFKDNDGTTVERINDVRGAAYGFATNAVHCPTLIMDERGNPHHIQFTQLIAASTTIDSCDDLVWEKPITNIRAVFLVQDTTDGGGQFLGKTARIAGTGDFMRAAEHGRNYANRIFHTSAGQQKVWEGALYINGERRDMLHGYPYKGGGTYRYLDDNTYAVWWAPHVDSVQTTGDTAADCFSFNNAAGGRSGFRRLCECLIYTNTVTESERLAITGYLMEKWLNCEVNISRSFATNSVLESVDTATMAGLDVAAEQTAYAGTVVDEGSFIKSGPGVLYLDDYANAKGTLRVSGGTLELKSAEVSLDDIPQDAYIHVDAARLDTFNTTLLDSGATRVLAWRDRRGEGYPTAQRLYAYTNGPTLKMDALNGLPVVDFGPYLFSPTASWSDKNASPALKFDHCATLHSAFLVYGSAQGGGSLIGARQAGPCHGWHHGYGIKRLGGSGDDPDTPMVVDNHVYGNYGYNNIPLPGCLRAKLNGVRVNAAATGLSGSWDLVSLVSYESFGSGGFSSSDYNKEVGGQEIGEAIFYKQGLSHENTAKVEAYLAKKWFNRGTPGFRAASASNLVVESGATLKLVGDQPITVSAFSGSGVIDGSLALTDEALFEVVVQPDGSIAALDITGAVDLSSGGSIKLTGDVANLVQGRHTLINCASLSPMEPNQWKVLAHPEAPAMTLRARVLEGRFVLDVFPLGTLLRVQ